MWEREEIKLGLEITGCWSNCNSLTQKISQWIWDNQSRIFSQCLQGAVLLPWRRGSWLKSILDAGDCYQVAIRQWPLFSGGFGANPPRSCVKVHISRTGRCLGSDSMDLLIFMIPDEPDNVTWWVDWLCDGQQWVLFTFCNDSDTDSSTASVANLLPYLLDKQTTRWCRKLAGPWGSEGLLINGV